MTSSADRGGNGRGQAKVSEVFSQKWKEKIRLNSTRRWNVTLDDR